MLPSKIFPPTLYPRDPSKDSEKLQRCYELLNLTSRSFATVIQQLHPELRDVVAIFYIVLRALDTIEDDMTLSTEKKIPLLRTFDQKLQQKGWTFTESGPNEKDRIVLEEFDIVIEEFHNLKPGYQEIISDVTKKMGNGMADYAIDEDFNRDGLETVKDFDLYCYYVAGLVGDGLTKMAILSKFGSPSLADKPYLHKSMGLFLQKTNIIRDFREDLDDNRTFYPKELWGKHISSLKLLADPANAEQGTHVITEMTVNALSHVAHVLEYLDNIAEPSLFRFCAIPQVMAIATLELIFANPIMFQKHLKLRRGLTAKLIMESTDRASVYAIFREYTRKIHLKNSPKDPNFLQLEVLCGKIEQTIEEHAPKPEPEIPVKKPEEQQADSKETMMLFVVSGIAALSCMALMVFVAWMCGADFGFHLTELVPVMQKGYFGTADL